MCNHLLHPCSEHHFYTCYLGSHQSQCRSAHQCTLECSHTYFGKEIKFQTFDLVKRSQKTVAFHLDKMAPT